VSAAVDVTTLALTAATAWHAWAVDLDVLARVGLLVAVPAVLVSHHVGHLLVSRWLGYRPSMRWWPPEARVTGAFCSRTDVATVRLAPLLVVSLVGAVLAVVAPGPGGELLWTFVVVLNAVVSVDDVLDVGAVLRRPRGTLVYVTPSDGARYVYEPDRL